MATARVLLVDDEPGVLDVASRVLTRSGYCVIPASNGPQALNIINTQPAIDLVISDVRMPGMQGPALIEAIRQASPSTALMLMSAYPLDTLTQGVAFLQKPFLSKDLIAAVERTLANAARAGADLVRECNHTRQLCAESERILVETGKAIQDAMATVPESRRLRSRLDGGASEGPSDGQPSADENESSKV